MNNTVACIVLAAGSSSRMGTPKSLLSWGKSSVLCHILNQAKNAGLEQLVVVIGAHHEEIERELPEGVALLCRNPEWEKGMGSSIGKGVICSKQHFPGSEGILVLLADQPLVDKRYLQKILRLFHKNPDCIIATEYAEGAGVPALFPLRHFDTLEKLGPGMGAKSLMRNCRPEELVLVPAGDAGRDMDTPEAYRKLKRIAGIDN